MPPHEHKENRASRERLAKRALRVRLRITLIAQLILLAGIVFAVWSREWKVAITTTGVLCILMLPLIFKRRFKIVIPPELEGLTVLVVFAALFLGEIRGYYTRYWWWDAMLHTASGFLLGILGFFLVHILNEHEEIEVHMKPAFVALFAFCFSMALGAIWEIFEFAMDSAFGLNMQKSGLVDTMWDLAVNAIGAICISWLGYVYLRTEGKESFLERWIVKFVEANPRLFKETP